MKFHFRMISSTKLICSLLLASFSLGMVSAQDYPALSQEVLVNDFADVLSDNEENRLNLKLKTYSDTTSTQIAIVLLESLEKYTGDKDYPIEQYAVDLAHSEGIGQKIKSNGLLILVALAERKIRLEVGYGLEPVITDGISKRIIEKQIKPHFRNENYYLGLDEAVDAIIAYAAGEYTAEDDDDTVKFPFFLIVGGILLFIILMAYLGRRFNAENYTGKGQSNMPPWYWGGFGGGSGGGSFGGGGFGGFGGGGFGGGGASGSW